MWICESFEYWEFLVSRVDIYGQMSLSLEDTSWECSSKHRN